jgi:hypothetical protein
MSSRGSNVKIFIRNAKKIRDKICYLDVLRIRMPLLIGRIKNIGETEFHISLVYLFQSDAFHVLF